MGEQKVFEEVLIALRQIIRAIDLHSRKLVQGYGLTGPQLIVLKSLGGIEELSVGELAKQVNLSPATVTGVLDRLEKRDLVERMRDDADKRRVIVRITQAGLAVLGTAPSLLQEHFMARFGELKQWEQNLVLSSLQRVAAMMETEELETANLLDSEPLLHTTKDVVEMMPADVVRSGGRPREGKHRRA